MVIFKSKLKNFESDLILKLCGKRLYILLKVTNTLVRKLIQTLSGNIMLMIFLLK